MRILARLIGAAAITFLLIPSANAQTRSRPMRPASSIPVFDAAVQPYLDHGVPGVSVGVRKGSWSVRETGYGETDVEHGMSCRSDSIFQIASLTKQLTAAAIMRLAELGKLSVRDDIRKYIPELNTKGYTVTIEHLLRHTSGLPEPATEQMTLPLTHAAAIALVNARPFRFAPGTQWEYSNSGYYGLGVIIERVSGMTYEEYLEQTFFLPLGMTHTAYCGRPPASPIPSGYHLGSGSTTVPVAPIHMSVIYSAGAVCSSAGDLVRWTTALRTGRAVSMESYEAMISPTILLNGSSVGYGYGLVLDRWLGYDTIEHSGHLAGFQSYLAYFPAADLTIAVLINRSMDVEMDAPSIGREIARMILSP